MGIENYDRKRIEQKGESVFAAILKMSEEARKIVEDDSTISISSAITKSFDKNYPKIETDIPLIKQL